MTRAVGERRAGEGETGFERVMRVSGDEGCERPRHAAFSGELLPEAIARPAPQSGRSRAEDGGPALFCFAMQSGRTPAAEKRDGPPLRLARASGLLATLKRPPARPLTVLEAETGFPRRPFLWSRPGAFRTKPETRELNAPGRRARDAARAAAPEMQCRGTSDHR